MMSKSEGAIVLLSGGLDSTVALADIQTRHPVLTTLTFDYGQRAVQREIAAARRIADHYQVPNRVIALPWLAELLPAILKADAQDRWPEDADAGFSLSKVWVPNRNGLFLNIAASFAEALKAQIVVFGANAEEGAEFPDNSPAFRDALTTSLSYSTLNGIRVETPVGELSKTGIIERGLGLDVPFHLIWSCYDREEAQCGSCPSCLRVKAARDHLIQTGHPRADIAFKPDRNPA